MCDNCKCAACKCREREKERRERIEELIKMLQPELPQPLFEEVRRELEELV